VVRLFCHLGHVGADDRALAGVEIEGDFWSADPTGHTVVDSRNHLDADALSRAGLLHSSVGRASLGIAHFS